MRTIPTETLKRRQPDESSSIFVHIDTDLMTDFPNMSVRFAYPAAMEKFQSLRPVFAKLIIHSWVSVLSSRLLKIALRLMNDKVKKKKRYNDVLS